MNRPLDQHEFVARLGRIQRQAVETASMGVKTAAFWEMENLSSSFFKQRRPGQSLKDPKLPVEVRPIAHCGMGIGAVEDAGFDASRLTADVESYCDPSYRLFAYEGTGAMLALYEPDLFGTMAKYCGRLGLLPLAPLQRPRLEEFLPAFDEEVRRLFAHGYGRMLYFKNMSIVHAAKAAAREESFQLSASVQGIAFAYAMVNNSDLARVLRAGDCFGDANLRRFFEAGLIYALEFWEWMAPGFLAGLEDGLAAHSHLIGAARRGVDAGLARGWLRAFAVEGD